MGRVTAAVVLAVVATVMLGACNWAPLTAHHWQCGTHAYYVNLDGAPAGALTMVENAFAQVDAITTPRLSFHYGGTTTAPTSQAGKIIVRWTTLGGGEYGEGAPEPWPDGPTFNGGYVEIEKAYPANQGLVLHEVGHVLNLGHVNEAGEAMQPDFSEIRYLTNYGPGDIAGLSEQAQQCVS